STRGRPRRPDRHTNRFRHAGEAICAVFTVVTLRPLTCMNNLPGQTRRASEQVLARLGLNNSRHASTLLDKQTDPRGVRPWRLTVAELSRLPVAVTEVWEWQLDGACREADPRLFFH